MKSVLRVGNSVKFPEFLGERVYMLPFMVDKPLPTMYQRWQETVDQMLVGIYADVSKPSYLMVDQQYVRQHTTHRRGGVHIDGAWVNGVGHYVPGRHRVFPDNVDNQLVLLASNVLGSVAYVGETGDECGDGGDCSHVNMRAFDKVPLAPFTTWYGDARSLLHESIPLTADSVRTSVRLNVSVH